MSGSNSGGATSTQTTDPWSGQQPYLQDLFREAQGYFQGQRPDTGDTAALSQAGVASLTGAATDVQPYITGAQTAGGRLTSGEFLDPSANPALQKYIEASNKQITNQFTENILPQLTSGAAASGNIGSSRQGVAEGISAGKTLDAVQRNTAAQQNAAYGQGLKALTAGVALAPQTAGLSTIPGDIYATAAQRQYGTQNLQSNQALEYLQAYQNLIGGGYGGTTQSTGPGTESGGVSGALGGAASGYAASGGNWYAAGAGAVAGYFA